MQATKENILEIIYGALRNINEERAADDQIALSEGTLLFGGDSSLDSLSLVSVIVDVETKVGDELGTHILLTDDKAMSRKVSPFTDVRSLTEYIMELLS